MINLILILSLEATAFRTFFGEVKYTSPPPPPPAFVSEILCKRSPRIFHKCLHSSVKTSAAMITINARHPLSWVCWKGKGDRLVVPNNELVRV